MCFGGGVAGVLGLDFDELFFDDFAFDFDFVLGLFNLLISSKPFVDLVLYGLDEDWDNDGGVGGDLGVGLDCDGGVGGINGDGVIVLLDLDFLMDLELDVFFLILGGFGGILDDLDAKDFGFAACRSL